MSARQIVDAFMRLAENRDDAAFDLIAQLGAWGGARA